MIILGSIVAVTAISAVVVFNHPAFGRLPRGGRLARIELSPHYHEGVFRNLSITPAMTGDKGFFRSVWDYLFNKPEDTSPDDSLPTVKTDLKSLSINENLVVWLGHSSLYIQQDGLRILVDPVLTNEFPASLMFSPFKGTLIYSPDDIPDIDILMITHDHWDHLDYATLKKLRGRIDKIICPLGVGEHLEYWKFPVEKISELDWNEKVNINDTLSIEALPARHFSGRLLKRNRTLWCGYMIGGSRNIYISGDGGYDRHFKNISSEYPCIDLAIMENGQYSSNWRFIHLLPEDLEKAVTDLRPHNIMTVHNSKYSLAPHSWKEPMETFYTYAHENGLGLMTPLIGEVAAQADTAVSQRPWWREYR